MHKDLQAYLPTAGLSLHFLDLFQGHLSGQNHPLKSQAGHPIYPFLIVDGHLGGSMQMKARHQSSCQRSDAQVLHEHRICSHFIESNQVCCDIGKLVFPNKSVNGNICFYTMQMGIVYGFSQLRLFKIGGKFSGAKPFAAEVNGIGSCGNRCSQGFG
jgi:hypothetical protein